MFFVSIMKLWVWIIKIWVILYLVSLIYLFMQTWYTLIDKQSELHAILFIHLLSNKINIIHVTKTLFSKNTHVNHVDGNTCDNGDNLVYKLWETDQKGLSCSQ